MVDFCANDPVVGDTSCTYPTGFTMGVPASGVTVSGLSGFSTSTGSWVTSNSLQCGAGAGASQTLLYTNATAQTPSGTSTPITFNITSVTNSSTNGSFYARIVTFDTSAHTTSEYTCTGATRPSSYADGIDYGGVALSTAQNIAITAKVFETLSFCVYQTSCGTQAQLTLGDPTTGALSTSTAYINNNAKYTLATNAQNGVSVQMFGQTLCRAATLSFANCPTGASSQTISAVGATPVALSTGSEQFGMCVNPISGTTAAADYIDSINSCTGGAQVTGTYSGTSKFGFDDTNGANGTNGTSGSTVLTSSGAVSSASSQFIFLGDIAATTEAGIYQSNLNMVATGTF
ncbi:MAG TPA: hypothetical protein VFK97_02260 [Candidatus Saccharimonadales bacterium]|nr:hypothetical protein [Candidatus Saccharimonadales bacterium]